MYIQKVEKIMVDQLSIKEALKVLYKYKIDMEWLALFVRNNALGNFNMKDLLEDKVGLKENISKTVSKIVVNNLANYQNNDGYGLFVALSMVLTGVLKYKALVDDMKDLTSLGTTPYKEEGAGRDKKQVWQHVEWAG